MLLKCRFYKEKYPEVDDVVMVNVRRITPGIGAYVSLLEYNNIEGMVHLFELSRRQIGSVNKKIQEGEILPAVVIQVDNEKAHINLSNRRVSPKDAKKCSEEFAKAKAVNSILSHVAKLLNYDSDDMLEKLYKNTAWRYEEKTKKASAYDFFKQAATDPSILAECGLDKHTKKILLSDIKRNLTSQVVKIRADIEVACYEYQGIDAVKAALKAGLATSTEELPIKIIHLAAPHYVVTTETSEITEGLIALQNAIYGIQKRIIGLGGIFDIKIAPKVVTATKRLDLANQILLRILSLEDQTDFVDTSIEIFGIPLKSDENILELVHQAALGLGVHLSSNDVEDAFRMPLREVEGTVDIGSDMRNSVGIVVKLSSNKLREKLVSEWKKEWFFSTRDVGLDLTRGIGYELKSVYINERLTPLNRFLFYQARGLKRKGSLVDAWTSNGNIFVRVTEGGKEYAIEKTDDLERF